jgi:hypothetical protein
MSVTAGGDDALSAPAHARVSCGRYRKWGSKRDRHRHFRTFAHHELSFQLGRLSLFHRRAVRHPPGMLDRPGGSGRTRAARTRTYRAFRASLQFAAFAAPYGFDIIRSGPVTRKI